MLGILLLINNSPYGLTLPKANQLTYINTSQVIEFIINYYKKVS